MIGFAVLWEICYNKIVTYFVAFEKIFRRHSPPNNYKEDIKNGKVRKIQWTDLVFRWM